MSSASEFHITTFAAHLWLVLGKVEKSASQSSGVILTFLAFGKVIITPHSTPGPSVNILASNLACAKLTFRKALALSGRGGNSDLKLHFLQVQLLFPSDPTQ